MVRANDIDTAKNLTRQIEFWITESRGALYVDHTYSKECFEKAKKAAEALSLLGGSG